jgi:protein-S-isoprenylcysteine O-methyltransferase Ste14
MKKPLIYRDFDEISLIGEPRKMSEIVGYGLLVMVFICFCWFCLNFFGVLLEVEKEKGHVLMEEGYYCLLIPLFVPVSVLAAYGNWLAVKFFRHN